jgi:hypothetical protein
VSGAGFASVMEGVASEDDEGGGVCSDMGEGREMPREVLSYKKSKIISSTRRSTYAGCICEIEAPVTEIIYCAQTIECEICCREIDFGDCAPPVVRSIDCGIAQRVDTCKITRQQNCTGVLWVGGGVRLQPDHETRSIQFQMAAMLKSIT